jgi:hypothetical protein
MVDDILDRYIKNPQEHQDFYAFLFKMWCASRRSKKIRNELEGCIRKVIDTIKELLANAVEYGSLKFNLHESVEISKALLALFDGFAFHLLINHSENLKDKKFWLPIRNMILAVLKRGKNIF